MLPFLGYVVDPDADKLIIYHNPTGAATFDPSITTKESTTVIWQTEAGTTVTTGTTHNFSYTPTAGPKKCTVTVRGGLGLVTVIDCGSDYITLIKGIEKTRTTIFYAHTNSSFVFNLGNVPFCTVINLNYITGGTINGSITQLNRAGIVWYLNSGPNITGSLLDIPITVGTIWLFGCTGIAPASIAHLVAIRDIRIYSMGWTAQQNTGVLLSAWGARANYTYASGIALRISAPTGTPVTEPPEEDGPGHDTSDWAWNAGTSRYDPLTGYAVISDLQTDFYSEGFKPWAVTIV
jgi:hypothetical protein